MSSVSESNIAKPRHLQSTASELGFVLIFTAALFSSALLLFLVQPLVGKALLPKLGGTPQVWTTCMVFFQAMLFAGYLHAHFSSRIFGPRGQAALHVGLAGLALLTLPIGINSISNSPDTTNPILWLTAVLIATIGAPMFVISATAPLLQKWVAHTDHPAARDPYFMYAASNAGSLLALLIYPTLVEPYFDLGGQAWWWSIGYLVLLGAVGICLWLFLQNYQAPDSAQEDLRVAEPIKNVTRLHWLLLSFVPSSLLLGVTTYVSSDVATVPLFWIVPLTLYLLTFILAFSSRQLISENLALRAQAIFLALLTVTLFSPALRLPVVAFPLHVLAFFFTALVCHGKLARGRPDARHLTEFYLWLSLGGMLGGIFNGLIAPVIFDRLYEYPLALMLACLLRPAVTANRSKWASVLDVLLPLLLVGAAVSLLNSMSDLIEVSPKSRFLFTCLVLIAVAFATINFSSRNVRFAVVIGAAYFWLMLGSSSGNFSQNILTDRSFFGVHKVYRNGELNVLMHGTTIHGAQFRDPARAREPLSYYHRNGPFGDLFRAIEPQLGARPVAVVGLGAGEIACHGRVDSEWTYYEIDPVVEQVARNPSYFTYLRDCPPKVSVVLGDARLTIRNTLEERYGLIIIDAFNSDAIPTHLLTKEAIADYFRKLAPDGILALHISNRHLNLAPVVGNLAKAAGLTGRLKNGEGNEKEYLLATPATLAVLARKDGDLGVIAADTTWTTLSSNHSRVWSDDYINILGAMKVFQ